MKRFVHFDCLVFPPFALNFSYNNSRSDILVRVKSNTFLRVLKYFTIILNTFILSLTLTLFNGGIDHFSLIQWLESWLVAFITINIVNMIIPNITSFICNKTMEVTEEKEGH
jgi:hypothetical protein